MITIDDLFDYYSSNPAQHDIQRHPIFLEYRSQNNGVIDSSNEEMRLIQMIESHEEKWFVPHFVSILSKIPDSLVDPLLHLSIEMKMVDMPNFHEFRHAVVNLIGFIYIEEFLQRVFVSIKTVLVRETIIRLFDEFGPLYPLSHMILPGGYIRVDGLETWFWNGTCLERNYDDNTKHIVSYLEKITPLLHDRMKILLEVFLEPKEKRGPLRMTIVHQLPGELIYYPPQLQSLAREMLTEYEKDDMIFGIKFRDMT